METNAPKTSIQRPRRPNYSGSQNGQSFHPVGAMAFFIVLILLCAAIWFLVYIIMLNRS